MLMPCVYGTRAFKTGDAFTNVDGLSLKGNLIVGRTQRTLDLEPRNVGEGLALFYWLCDYSQSLRLSDPQGPHL